MNLNPQIACHTDHSNSNFPTALPPHLTLSKSFEPLNMGSESAPRVAYSPQESILRSHDLCCKSRHTLTERLLSIPSDVMYQSTCEKQPATPHTCICRNQFFLYLWDQVAPAKYYPPYPAACTSLTLL